MRKASIWALGILFGSILAYIAWNGFMTHNFLMGETKVVTGKIIEVFPSREVKSYSRRIKYVYAVNDNYYFDFQKLGTKDKKQSIGNDLKIVYSIKNPKRNRIAKHINNYRHSKGVKYYSNLEKGYIQMDLINGIFKYKEYINGGKIANNFVGEYEVVNDSLKFIHYLFEANSSFINKPKLFVVDSDNTNRLIESETKGIFIKIDKKRR